MAKMSDTRTFELGDGERLELTVNKLEPVDAYVLTARLGNVLIPAIVALKQGKTTELQNIVNTMFDRLGTDVATQIMYDVFRGCVGIRTDAQGAAQKCDLSSGKTAVNNAFRGNVKTMFLALGFALEVNFGDFFDVRALAARMTPTPSA